MEVTLDLLDLSGIVLGSVGLIAGIVSILLGINSLWLGKSWANDASETSTQINVSLSKIESQAQILAQLNQTQIDKLINIIDRRDRSPQSDEITASFLRAIQSGGVFDRERDPSTEQNEADLSEKFRPNVPGLPEKMSVDERRESALTVYFVIYFYKSLLHYLAGTFLPYREKFDPANDFHNLLKTALDSSSSNFHVVARHLDEWVRMDPEFVNQHNRRHFGDLGKRWRDFVCDASGRFAQKDALRESMAAQSGPQGET